MERKYASKDEARRNLFPRRSRKFRAGSASRWDNARHTPRQTVGWDQESPPAQRAHGKGWESTGWKCRAIAWYLVLYFEA